MMSIRTVIKNGTIFTHDKTIYNMDILIEDGKITSIDNNISAEDHCDVVDAEGMYVIPGLIDMHCELCEPGYDFRETMETGGTSAICGGFTALTQLPNTNPVVDNKTVVEYIVSKSKTECALPIYPYGALTMGCEGKEMAEVGEMQIRGIIAVSDGDKCVQDSWLAKTTFQYAAMFDMPIILHSEDTALSEEAGVNDGYIATQMGLVGAPVSAESMMVARHLLLAEEFNIKIHLCHISTGASVELIRQAKKRGMRVTAETSPQYFSLTEESALNYNSLAKVNPPLRCAEDVSAVIEGIKDGTIDVISSDHKPNTIDSKEVEFDLASYGISSFETALPVSYTYLVKPGHIDMERLVHMTSTKPSELLSINRSRLAVGSLADLTIIAPEENYVVDASKFQSKARYSPYNGKELFGKVKYTFVEGKKYDLA